MKQTYFDSVITSNNLQIIKIIIPYMSPNIRKFFAIYIKVIEFKNIDKLNKQLNPPSIYDAMKDMLDSDSLEMYNTLIELFNMLKDNPDMANSMFGNLKDIDFDLKDLFD